MFGASCISRRGKRSAAPSGPWSKRPQGRHPSGCMAGRARCLPWPARRLRLTHLAPKHRAATLPLQHWRWLSAITMCRPKSLESPFVQVGRVRRVGWGVGGCAACWADKRPGRGAVSLHTHAASIIVVQTLGSRGGPPRLLHQSMSKEKRPRLRLIACCYMDRSARMGMEVMLGRAGTL